MLVLFLKYPRELEISLLFIYQDLWTDNDKKDKWEYISQVQSTKHSENAYDCFVCCGHGAHRARTGPPGHHHPGDHERKDPQV